MEDTEKEEFWSYSVASVIYSVTSVTRFGRSVSTVNFWSGLDILFGFRATDFGFSHRVLVPTTPGTYFPDLVGD
jgi:hypothetical protein